jgi:hypothetical protein
MADEDPGRRCLECGQPVLDSEKFLIVSSADGKQQVLHTICFTNTTFDPDRFVVVTEPESERG